MTSRASTLPPGESEHARSERESTVRAPVVHVPSRSLDDDWVLIAGGLVRINRRRLHELRQELLERAGEHRG